MSTQRVMAHQLLPVEKLKPQLAGRRSPEEGIRLAVIIVLRQPQLLRHFSHRHRAVGQHAKDSHARLFAERLQGDYAIQTRHTPLIASLCPKQQAVESRRRILVRI